MQTMTLPDLTHPSGDKMTTVRPTKSRVVQAMKAVARTEQPINDASRAADREITKRLSTGDREIARGVGHDLEDVLAEARIILKRR